MKIVSAPGALVRDPVTQRVVSEHDPLTIDPLDVHWARLLIDGDVLPAPRRKPAAKAETHAEPPAPAAEAKEPRA